MVPVDKELAEAGVELEEACLLVVNAGVCCRLLYDASVLCCEWSAHTTRDAAVMISPGKANWNESEFLKLPMPPEFGIKPRGPSKGRASFVLTSRNCSVRTPARQSGLAAD